MQERCERLESLLQIERKTNENLEDTVKTLKHNITSLHETCRVELARKEATITELRKERDNIAFRRNGNHPRGSDLVPPPVDIKVPIFSQPPPISKEAPSPALHIFSHPPPPMFSHPPPSDPQRCSKSPSTDLRRPPVEQIAKSAGKDRGQSDSRTSRSSSRSDTTESSSRRHRDERRDSDRNRDRDNSSRSRSSRDSSRDRNRNSSRKRSRSRDRDHHRKPPIKDEKKEDSRQVSNNSTNSSTDEPRAKKSRRESGRDTPATPVEKIVTKAECDIKIEEVETRREESDEPRDMEIQIGNDKNIEEDTHIKIQPPPEPTAADPPPPPSETTPARPPPSEPTTQAPPPAPIATTDLPVEQSNLAVSAGEQQKEVENFDHAVPIVEHSTASSVVASAAIDNEPNTKVAEKRPKPLVTSFTGSLERFEKEGMFVKINTDRVAPEKESQKIVKENQSPETFTVTQKTVVVEPQIVTSETPRELDEQKAAIETISPASPLTENVSQLHPNDPVHLLEDTDTTHVVQNMTLHPHLNLLPSKDHLPMMVIPQMPVDEGETPLTQLASETKVHADKSKKEPPTQVKIKKPRIRTIPGNRDPHIVPQEEPSLPPEPEVDSDLTVVNLEEHNKDFERNKLQYLKEEFARIGGDEIANDPQLLKSFEEKEREEEKRRLLAETKKKEDIVATHNSTIGAPTHKNADMLAVPGAETKKQESNDQTVVEEHKHDTSLVTGTATYNFAQDADGAKLLVVSRPKKKKKKKKEHDKSKTENTCLVKA